MANRRAGAFGSRKGIPQRPVMVQGNTLSVTKDPKPYFADYDHLQAQCTALTTSAGMVLTFLRDPELMARVNAQSLNETLKTFNEHVRSFKGRLAIIKNDTEQLRANVKAVTLDILPTLLDHTERYTDFMNDWTRIVMFSQDLVLDHFRPLGLDIPYLCPFSKGFDQANATTNQMTAEQFDGAVGRQHELAASLGATQKPTDQETPHE